jgi:TolA-binding protein
MRRHWCLAVGLVLLASNRLAFSQDDAQRAAAVAEQEAAEERYRRLNSAVDELAAAQVAIQKRLAILAEDIRELREEMTRSNSKFVARDDLQRLAKDVQEVENKRADDRREIMKELEKLLKMPAPAPVLPPPAEPAAPKPSTKTPDKGYYHVVEPGQSLSVIIQAYRDQGVKVIQQQVLDANPGLNPNRIRAGQKIFIPDASR